MPRVHYIVRLSKKALVPGRSLTFRRGDEIPASVSEIRTEDPEEADRIAREHLKYDGDLTAIFKVNRQGQRDQISGGYAGNNFASHEDRERLDVGDILDFVTRLASMEDADGQELIQEAQELLAKHDALWRTKGA